MTELTITPKTADKTAKFKGAIAAGEHVAVTIKGGAEWLGEDDGAHLSLRVLDLVTGRTLAIFPRPPETEEADSVSEPSASADAETDAETATGPQTDAWSTTGDDNTDLYCELNLNTTRMVNAARHMLQVPVLFVMGEKDDQSDAVTRTLYFRDRYEVGFWPERIGDDTPYDLDRWPKQIDEWTELVEGWTERLNGLILSAERFTDKKVGGVSKNGVTIMLNDGDDDADTVVDLYDGEVSATQMNTAIAAMGATKVDKTTTVNGHALSDDVTVSKSDVGLGNVANTGDSATPVSGGTTKFTTGGAYTELGKKADKVSSPTAGNFAGLDASGNLVDSGKKASDFATAADKANLQSAISEEASARDSAVSSESSARQSADSALSSRLSTLEGEIPSEASSSNQLADKAHVAAAIAAVKNSRFAVVEELPSSGEENVIYLVPAEDGAGDDVFDEYIWLVGSGGVGAWEKIASTRIDLSGYATTAGVNVLLSGKVDKETGKGLSSNDYTAGDKAKVAAAATGADVANAVASCLTRAEAVDGFTKWEVDTIAPAYGFISCEWNESSTPGNTGWVLTMHYQDTQVSLLLQGDHDATSLTYSDIITLSRTRIHPAIDAALSQTSENPVQNKVVKAALDGKRGVLDLAVYEDGIAPWTMTMTGVAPQLYEWDQTESAWVYSSGGAELALRFDSPSSEWHIQSYDAEYDVWSDVVEPLEAAEDALRLEFESGQVFTRPVVDGTYSTEDALARTSQLAGKADAYDFSAIETISSAGTEQSPNEVTPVDAQNKRVSVEAANAHIAVALPAASANGHIRDFMLTLDCSSLTEGDEPNVIWGTAFHPRTDAGTDFACAAGVRNVYYISEYAAGEFVVGGWQETAGGNAQSGGSGT